MLGRDNICAVAAASDAASMWKQVVGALEKTHTVELRLDWLSGEGEITRFLRRVKGLRPKASLWRRAGESRRAAGTGER